MQEVEFKVGDYIFHSTFGVGKITRPTERDGKPGYELDFKDRPGHFMSLDILRRSQPAHPDSLRVFAYEHKAEALRLLQEDPSAIIIRAIGQSPAALERPDIERILTEANLISGPEQFKTWWGKALVKLRNSAWLEITLQGSRIFVRRLEKPRVVAPPSQTAAAPPRPVRSAPLPTSPSPPNLKPSMPAPASVSVAEPKPAPAPVVTPSFDVADFRRQLRLLEQTTGTLPEKAKAYLLEVAGRAETPLALRFEALLTAYEKGGISKAELLAQIEQKAIDGAGLEKIGNASVRSDIALLILEENNLPPVLLHWLSGSFISDLALAELVLDRLVELRQFEVLVKAIEKATTGLESSPALLEAELNFVRWMSQKEPNLAALALANGYPWSPAPLTARITQVWLALVQIEPRSEESRESRREGIIELARLLESRSIQRDPATITRLMQAITLVQPATGRLVDAFGLLTSQPDRPLVPKLVKYLELNLASLEDSPLVVAVLQLEVGRSEKADFGLVHWWLGQVVRLKSLKLARSLFEFLLSRLSRAIGEDEQMRYLLLLMQMLDLELISQSQATSLRTSLNELFRKIAARKIKAQEENGFLLNEMVAAVNEVILRLEQRLNQALMDKESAEAEVRSLRPAKVIE